MAEKTVKKSRKQMVQISKSDLKKLERKIQAEERRKAKKLLRKFDGFSPAIETKVASAIREVWQRSSEARKICVKRCELPNGYSKCEGKTCTKRKVPKVYIDHIVPAGKVTSPGFLERMFVPSNGLQGLCKICHDAKTKSENEAKRKIVKGEIIKASPAKDKVRAHLQIGEWIPPDALNSFLSEDEEQEDFY